MNEGMKEGREIIRKGGRAVEREEKREEVREYRSYENDEGAFKLRGCKRCVRQRMNKLMR